jgi:hypothetical protein
MTWARRFWLRLQTLLWRERNNQRLDDELQFHLDQQVAENMSAGMSGEEARYAAKRAFGNPAMLKEETRDTWGWVWLEQIAQDIRYGLRLLLKNRSFTLVAVVTLALGIAATATLWSIFDGAYIHFGETKQANRSVLLTQQLKNQPAASRFSAPEYFDIAGLKHYQFYDGFFALRGAAATLSQNFVQAGDPEFVHVIRATANIFPLYGITAILGRTFAADEDRPGEQNVAVLTYRLWNTRFGQDPNVVGKTIYLDRAPYTVIGVMPRRSQHWGADVYAPLKLNPASNNREQRDLRIVGIAKAGVSADQSKPELAFLASREAKLYRAVDPEYEGLCTSLSMFEKRLSET